MKAKKVYEVLGDLLRPKKLSFDDFYKWMDKKAMMTMYYIRKDKENKDIYDKIIKDGYEAGLLPIEVSYKLYKELEQQVILRRERKKRKTNESIREII